MSVRKKTYYILLPLLLIACLSFSTLIAGRTKQIAVIHYRMEGCFGGEQNTLIVYQKDNQTIARFRVEDEPWAEYEMDREAFNHFLKELVSLESHMGCTNVEYYTVFIGNEIIRKRNGSCGWKEFDKFKRILLESPL